MKMTMTMTKLFMLLNFLLFTMYTIPAEAVICPSIADVYIDQRDPDTNFNFRTRIIISYHPTYGIARGLFKFDIPESIGASEVTAATIYLSGSIHTGGGDAINVSCHTLNEPFSEGSDTWNSLSGGNYDNSISSSGAIPAGNDWETSFDVTALVVGNLEKLRDNGMLMKLQVEGPLNEYQNIASRESIDLDDFAPYLEIEYSENTSSSTTTEPVETSTTSLPVSSSTSSSVMSSSTTTTVIEDTTTILTSTTSTVKMPYCLAETIYGEDSKEVAIMRYVRDSILQHTPEGREIIQLYYAWSPLIIRLVEKDLEFRDEIKKSIDEFLNVIKESQ
jgi:hypothetical protein